MKAVGVHINTNKYIDYDVLQCLALISPANPPRSTLTLSHQLRSPKMRDVLQEIIRVAQDMRTGHAEDPAAISGFVPYSGTHLQIDTPSLVDVRKSLIHSGLPSPVADKFAAAYRKRAQELADNYRVAFAKLVTKLSGHPNPFETKSSTDLLAKAYRKTYARAIGKWLAESLSMMQNKIGDSPSRNAAPPQKVASRAGNSGSTEAPFNQVCVSA